MAEGASDPVASAVDRWREVMPQLDPSPLLVIGRLMRIAERCDSLLRPPFAEAGLASGDFDALAALRRSGPPHSLTPGELAVAMLVTSGAVTKRIDRIERLGLATRSRSDADGRGRVVTLTPDGVALTERLMVTHLANERRILGALDAEQERTLAELLGLLLVSVEESASPDHGGARS
jgi:DNA-binding MarR family transcriptional regulator